MKLPLLVNRWTACMAVLLCCGWTTGTLAASAVEGAWEGKLQTGGQSLRIVFHISNQGDVLTATMDSPDQGAYGIAVDAVTFDGTMLRCEIKRIRGDFEGKLKEDGSIGGFWTQFGQSMVLPLTRKTDAARKRPQEPVKPYPYLEEEVTFENKIAKVKFAGTLSKPTAGRRFPAVILISGSGPQDRNSEIMGHKLQDSQSDLINTQAEAARAELNVLMSPYMSSLLRHDPAAVLQKIRVPVLAVTGSLDTQTVATQNLPLIESALKSGGNRDYQVVELPGLNHLLQSAKTGAPSEYMEIEETVNSAALEIVGNWLTTHAGLAR